MLLFHLISFSVIVVALVLLFLSSSVTTLQGNPLTICCAYRLLLLRYTFPLACVASVSNRVIARKVERKQKKVALAPAS